MSNLFSINALGQDVPNNIPITSGISFGWIDKPLFFEVNLEGVEKPLRINFNVRNDKEKKALEFEIKPITESQLDLYFYNPLRVGDSGLSAPIALLTIDNDLLGFVFHVSFLSNSESFRLSYEFYHGQLRADDGGES